MAEGLGTPKDPVQIGVAKLFADSNGLLRTQYDTNGKPVAAETDGNHVADDRDNCIWISNRDMHSSGTEDYDYHAVSGYHCVGVRLDAAGEYLDFNFPVPAGFAAIKKAVLVYMAQGTVAGAPATDGLDIATHAGKAGEAYYTHTDSANGIDTGAVLDENIYEVDVSAALTDIAAGDYVYMRVTVPALVVDSGDRSFLGFKFRWE